MTALFFTLSARANQLPSMEVIGLVDKFKKTMVECPERIWSNYNWNGLNIVFLYPSQDYSWTWDIDPNVMRTVDNRDLPSWAFGSLYSFFEINGKNAQSLNMEVERFDGQFFGLGVHEFFHNQGQKGWSRKYSEEYPTYRGTAYPMDDRPRYYRRMLFDNLERYLISDREEYLKQGKYWFDKWVGEYPHETFSSMDSAEGTAIYVTTMARALAILGCTATDNQLKDHVLAQVRLTFGNSVSGRQFTLDGEGYDIGGLAALILRFNNTDLLDWNQKIAEGNSPLEVLFEGVSSIPEDNNEFLRQQFFHTATVMNREYGLLLDGDIENYSNKDYIRIPAPGPWIQSNLSPWFFVYSSKIDKAIFPYSQEHHFLSPTKEGSDYIFKTNAVVMRHTPHPCPEMYNFVLVPGEAINIENRVAHVSNEIIEGRLVGELKEDEEGYSYFCVE